MSDVDSNRMAPPYEAVVDVGGQGWRICHRPFNALLPGHFRGRASLMAALSAVLAGTVLPGPGDFVYRGQPMTLRRTLDPDTLPPTPLLTVQILDPPLQIQRLRQRLRQLEFVDGLAPLSVSLLNRARRLEADWSNHCWTAERELQLARRIRRLDAVLARFVEPDGHSAGSGIDLPAPGRAGSPTARRLAALGGVALAGEPEPPNVARALGAGRIAALALLRDASLDAALHLAWQWHRYDSGLADLVARIERVILSGHRTEGEPATGEAPMTAQPPSAAGYPIVSQRRSCDCGVACLAMIARVTYERAFAAFDAAGLATKYPRRPYASNFADLTRCARDIGCALTMRRFTGWTTLPAAAIVKVPCLGRPTRHWHWVVAVREGDDIAILDPWLGLAQRLAQLPASEAPHYTPTGNMLVPADR